MLKSLEIKNYAIIEHLIIHFDEKLNIITGETGAGKSILLGALGLTLGERADSKVLYDKNNKCFVEATFKFKNENFKTFFENNDLDFEIETSVRREIAVNGKSRAFINDTPVNLNTLKLLTEKLVNLHSQQETHFLNAQGFQISVLDYSAKNIDLLSKYRLGFKQWKEIKKSLKSAQERSALLQKDLDFNQFQLSEILEANLDNYNLANIEEELSILSHAEEIKSSLWDVISAIDNDNVSIVSLINNVSIQLNKLSTYSKELESLNDRIESILVEIQDVKNEADSIADGTELDNERIDELTEKVNIANKLLQKHQLNTLEELTELKNKLEENTSSVLDLSKEINDLEDNLLAQEKAVNKVAAQLSTNRNKVIPKVEKNITTTLQKIGMPNAKFVIKQNKKDILDAFGHDEISFHFSSNKGFEPQDLTKIASGGELSRVMLSIKYLLAGSSELATLIFDEIDTGISGEIAAKVGEVFQEISQKHQLISITHLPQIAAKADKHFFIYKEDNAEKTKTKIASLNDEQHVKAIARMLSGEIITDASLENAKLLVG